MIEFAELWDVDEEPIQGYSSGMRIRLAFSIATSFQPEVLLVDEVLAVGDEFFAAKSFRRIAELVQGGRAALVASHNAVHTFRLCNHIVWLEHGRVRRAGEPTDLMNEYFAELNAFELNKRLRDHVARVRRRRRRRDEVAAARRALHDPLPLGGRRRDRRSR